MASPGDMESAEDRFGRGVRRIREERGLSQKELAEKLRAHGLALHPSAIAKIEARDARAPRAIRLNEAEAIAECLGQSLDDILDRPSAVVRAAATLAERAADLAEESERAVQRVHKIVWRLESRRDFDWAREPAEIRAYRNRIVHSLARHQNVSDSERDQAERMLTQLSAKDDGEHTETP